MEILDGSAQLMLKPIALALQQCQADQATVSDGVEYFKDLLTDFRDQGIESREWLEEAEKRYNAHLSGVRFAANALDPKYAGHRLTKSEWKANNGFITEVCVMRWETFHNYIGGNKDEIRASFQQSGSCKRKNFVKT